MIKKNRVVSNYEAQNFCLLNNFSYFETSALSGENVFNSFQCLANKILNSDLFNNNELLKNDKNIILNQKQKNTKSCCG